MNRKVALIALAAVLAALCVPAAWAQMATVKGVAKDMEGKVMPGVVVQMVSKETGRKYELKTDKKGEFYSLGIATGRYDIKLLKDGQQVYQLSGFPVRLGEDNVLELDLAKERQAAVQQMTPEQQKQLEKMQEAQKEAQKVKGLNEKLAQAAAAQQAGNLDQAIAIMQETTQMDPTRDLLWFKLAEYERAAGAKATDPQQRTTMYQNAVEHYRKAIQLVPPAKVDQLAAYNNNLGEAYAKLGNTQEAAAAYQQAAQIDPAHAGQYYFNLGAIMTNSGKIDDAIAAFDKAIAADPTRAEAYYWKGVNLVGKATLGKGGKMEAPPGTEEAFQKYLELQPTGQFAEPAKQMLASIGAEIQTSFGKGKGATKKKP